MALIRVATTTETRSEIMQLVDIYHGEIVDVTLDSLMVQIVGNEDRVDSLIELLAHFGIQEMVRTGRVAMARGQREGSFKRTSAVWRAQANGKDLQGLERLRTGGV
jgi:acetolactate synthase-1/3 small subunit